MKERLFESSEASGTSDVKKSGFYEYIAIIFKII